MDSLATKGSAQLSRSIVSPSEEVPGSTVGVGQSPLRPYYQDSACTIYHGDCREILPRLGSFDIAVTSPPYNLGGAPWPHLGNWRAGDSVTGQSKWRNGSEAASGIQYGVHADNMPWDKYVVWQREVLALLWECCSAIYYNHKPRVIGGRLWLPLELIPSGIELRQIVTWTRPGGMNFNPTAYVPTYEWIMIMAHPAWRLRDRSASGIGDTWRMNPETNDHPAPFPLALPSNAIQTSAAKSLVDPFMGSGTSLRAAKDAGISATGIDTDERYCEIAAKRLAQEVLGL